MVDMFPKYYPKLRKPQDEKLVPLSLSKPVELKSSLATSGLKQRGQVCVYEFSLLVGCFKETSFSQVACASEIKNFQQCYYEAKKGTDYNRQLKRKGMPRRKSEANELLAKFNV